MEYLAHFEGAYLEDSYLMGIVAEGQNLRLKMLLALTSDHAAYAPPIPGEARCFREGSIFIERPKVVEWRSGKPMLSKDAEYTFDLGSVELYRHGPTLFRFITEWFDTTLETSRVSLFVD
jgi:hypothetical protein